MRKKGIRDEKRKRERLMTKWKYAAALVLTAVLLTACNPASDGEHTSDWNQTDSTTAGNIDSNWPDIDYSISPSFFSDQSIVLKKGLSYGFCGLTQYVGTQATTEIEGVLYADAFMLAKAFGLDAEYNQEEKKLILTRDETQITIPVGAENVGIQGTEYPCTSMLLRENPLMLAVNPFAKMFSCTAVDDDAYRLILSSSTTENHETLMKKGRDRFEFYEKNVYDNSSVACDQTGVGLFEKTPEKDRQVGVAYTTWHRRGYVGETGNWGTPLLGLYDSDNRDVIYQHGIWLRDAGVDFVFVDWSNNTVYDPATMADSRPDFRMIEEATDALFEVWSTIPGAPKICLFVGPGHTGQASIDDGRHQKKVDQIWQDYVLKYPDLYYQYEDKPLLICYGATPTQYGAQPAWTDSRYTVRWMTGYVGQQTALFDQTTLRSSGYWSWEERGAQTYTVDASGMVEAVTCVASWRAQGKPGDDSYIPAEPRNDGMTLKKQFQRAIDLGSHFVLVVSWNEWTRSEQPSAKISKDLEPSRQDGTFYLDLLREQIRKYKGLVD